MVQLLLKFIRATREANWTLHLECVKEMLPWVFAYDRVNYCRYLCVYFLDMTVLSSTHPEAHKLLQDGEFAVQRSTEASFSQVAVDQAVEQTVNRDMKTAGEIIGFSLNPGARKTAIRNISFWGPLR